MAILVTGGTGYIGSHTVVELLKGNEEVIILDNLSNSSPSVLSQLEHITGKKIKFYQADLLDVSSIEKVFKENYISSVIHFAALKSVGESNLKPMDYYSANVIGTLNLCRIMEKFNVYKLIFSSSATVYGVPSILPISENARLDAINPYGRTKLICEQLLEDLSKSNDNWKIIILRYFNPVGAHESGLIGENPKDQPNNLIPYITQVIIGEQPYVNVYGKDYDTKDGTGVRDYIHVVDLAKGHTMALKKIDFFDSSIEVFNLGTGKGYSVLEIINKFNQFLENDISYTIENRRNGDVAECYADPSKANSILKWKAEKKLDDICIDVLNYIMKQHKTRMCINDFNFNRRLSIQ